MGDLARKTGEESSAGLDDSYPGLRGFLLSEAPKAQMSGEAKPLGPGVETNKTQTAYNIAMTW